MTYNEFKQEAGLDKLPFRPCFNNKDVQRAITPIGVIFAGKDFNWKSKVQDVEPGFDENGKQVYWLTNVPANMH